MGAILSTIATIAFISVIIFLIRKEFKGEEGHAIDIPKKYKTTLIIVSILFLCIIGVMLYNNFISGHYNN